MSGFMQLQVWRENAVETESGCAMPETDWTPEDGPRVGQPMRAWWGCYSAPGYMDRTETCGPFASPAEAARKTFELFGDDERGSEDRAELARILRQIRGAK